MAFWYYIPGIVIGLIGLMMMLFGSTDSKNAMTWGLTLIVIGLVADAAVWFASLI